ncbi:hypothetical protein Tco_1015151 [Tanacetum coccineum]|uniref:Uncharacterized protein n=1 Tax=Tanacetum coccineum TaxID=301880 RepID=A0ABQ5FK28_9ASTR
MVFTTFPRIHSPPYPCFTSPSLPLSPPSPVLSSTPPPSPIHSLGYRAAMIRLSAKVASTSHSLPLPPPFILSPTISDAPSSGIPPPCPYQYEVGESSSAAVARPAGGLRADYGFVATMDREILRDPKRERLDYPKRLGGDQWMREILPTERLCHCILPYWADHRRSTKMRELRTADRTRQQQLIQTLTVMQSLQGQGQQGPAGGPAQPELPEEAGSSS